MSVRARAAGAYDPRGLPDERAPAVDPSLPQALRARGLAALADELEGLRHADVVRRPFVWRALTSATDVDAVRLRPLRGDEATIAAVPRAHDEPMRVDYAIEAEVTIDASLAPDAAALPRDALARLLAPIVAGLLVDEGRARDLGEGEPLVTSPGAATLVDPRIDAALDGRPLLLTCGTRFVSARVQRGAPRVGRRIADALGLAGGERVVAHLPLGEAAIDEAGVLLEALGQP
jgi:hypothetical protein